MRALLAVGGAALITLALPLFVSIVSAEYLPGSESASQVGPGRPGTVTLQSPWLSPPGDYQENCDGTFENGYCWRHQGIGEPYYGCFAEGFHGPDQVVGMRIYLSASADVPPDSTSDLFVWGSGPAGPGSVLAMIPYVQFPAIPLWPEVRGFDFEITAEVGPNFYVGSQANFGPGYCFCYYYAAADTDGPGGSPWTCIAPGMGYPTGWQDPSIVWGTTAAMGYGVYTATEQGVADAPADDGAEAHTTWGQVKRLFGP